MDARAVVVNIYLALEKASCKNLVERTRVCARAAGANFTNSEAGKWLAPFVAEHRKNDSKSAARGYSNLLHGRDCGRKTDGIADGIADGKLSTKRTGPRTESRTKNGRDLGLTRDKGISSLSPRSTDSLRSSALAFGEWPKDNDGLRKLAKFFMAAFGNITSEDTAKKHYPAYLETLSIFRSRSVPLVVAWQACTDCLEAHSFVPLFGAKIKKAIAFLPARETQPARRTGLRVVTAADLEDAI